MNKNINALCLSENNVRPTELNTTEKLPYHKPQIKIMETVSSITQNGSSEVLESSNGYLTGS